MRQILIMIILLIRCGCLNKFACLLYPDGDLELWLYATWPVGSCALKYNIKLHDRQWPLENQNTDHYVYLSLLYIVHRSDSKQKVLVKNRITHRIRAIREYIPFYSIGSPVTVEVLMDRQPFPSRQILMQAVLVKVRPGSKGDVVRSIVTALEVHGAWYIVQRTNLVAYS